MVNGNSCPFAWTLEKLPDEKVPDEKVPDEKLTDVSLSMRLIPYSAKFSRV